MARSGRARVLAKYLALQVPGWVAVAIALAAAVRWWELRVAWAAGLFALWVLKDLALFPVLRRAYEPGEESAAEALVGAQAVAVQPLAPSGYVRVGAELWRARVSGGASLPPGAAVRVRAVRGLTLLVEPEATGADPETGHRCGTARSA